MNASGPITQEQMAKLHTDFDSELAYGQAYQRAYREYEETRIAAGASIADEHFCDELYASREPIASKPGEEEWFVWVPVEKIHEYGEKLSLAWGRFGAGLGAMAMAVIVRLFPCRPKSDLRQQLDSLSSGEPDWLSVDRLSSGSQAEQSPGDT